MSDAKPTNTDADKSFQNLSEELQDEVARKQFARLVRRVLKTSLTFSGYGYVAFLLLLITSMRSIGEKNLTLAFLLYCPQVAWLLPMPFFLLPALLWQRKLFLALILTTGIFVWSVMGYRFGSDDPLPVSNRGADTLTLLSYNQGQQGNKNLQRFKNLIQPDFLVLQEASQLKLYAENSGYEELGYLGGEGEYAMLSKYPITDTSPVTFPYPPFTGHKQTVATRFEIDWNGTQIAIYSVHLPTPRDVLLYYRKGAFLYGIIGIPGTELGEKRKANQLYWDARLALSESLAKHLKEEKLPMIVAGDFNTPHFGYNHRFFESFLHDAHKTSGSGFGYTFPGTTHNPLSLGGPWMRLDYIFYDENWQGLRCMVEKKRPSQHRAIAVTLQLKSEN
jgi:endonuclease/exonuclease/phosphatase family metal-dependent hydrolase